MNRNLKRKLKKQGSNVIEIANGVIKVFMGLSIVPILIADGYIIYDMTIDHTSKICPLTSILGINHQIKSINNSNYKLEAFCGETKVYTFEKEINETRTIPYLEDIKINNKNEYMTIMKYKDIDINSNTIEITAKEDEIYIVNKNTAEIVNILKYRK